MSKLTLAIAFATTVIGSTASPLKILVALGKILMTKLGRQSHP